MRAPWTIFPLVVVSGIMQSTASASAGGRYQAEFDSLCRARVPARYCDCIRDGYVGLARRIGGEHASSVAEFMFDVSAMPMSRPNDTREMAMFRHPSIRSLGPLAGYAILDKAQAVLLSCRSTK